MERTALLTHPLPSSFVRTDFRSTYGHHYYLP
jgi:hypothetical protein